ncbi:MAG: 4-hydroxy-tetrahydrodipicolinate synthase [Clostridia bacterium]|nr:4-hydroxy-tetrahydrodipicolinate synthase [Clostridia bacterium]
MKKKVIFRGVGTALVTPFRSGKIDYPALDRLIEDQIAAGIGALIVGGTTGEAATLTDKERSALYAHTSERVGGRCPLIFGTGTNDTALALKHTKTACRYQPDGILVVTPYYNKGTAAGIVSHYRKIAEASDVPVLLYNVPSRTGVNLSLDQLALLAEEENIVGIKEASDSADRLCDAARFGSALPLYAGNDSQIYTVLALGGKGAVSVVSNLLPRRVSDITDLYFEGRHAESRAVQLSLLPLCRAMFTETNPVPVKFAMSECGMCAPEVRLPLAEATEETKKSLRSLLHSYIQK